MFEPLKFDCSFCQGYSVNFQKKQLCHFHFCLITVKTLKFGTPQTIAIIVLKIEKFDVNIALMHPKDADGMANRVDPDQTASSEAV